MEKKIKYFLSKEYYAIDLSFEEVTNFLSKQGIPSNIKGNGILSLMSTRIKSTYGNIDLETNIWLPGFTTGVLRFLLEFDKVNDSLEQRKKADNLTGLLAKYNPEHLKVGCKQRVNSLSKQYLVKNFWYTKYDVSTIKDYLHQYGIAAREDFDNRKGKYIQGIFEDIGIDIYLKGGFRMASINYDVEFNESLEQRKKADEVIDLLAKYNPEDLQL